MPTTTPKTQAEGAQRIREASLARGVTEYEANFNASLWVLPMTYLEILALDAFLRGKDFDLSETLLDADALEVLAGRFAGAADAIQAKWQEAERR